MRRKYIAMLKAGWGIMLEYRASIVIWMLYGFLPLISLAVWLSISKDGQPIAGYTRSDFISYYLATVFVRQATAVWVVWELDRLIRQGELSPRLLRPINPIHQEISANLAEKLLRIPLILLLLAPAALLIPGVRYDFSPLSLGAALLALAVAWALVFLSNYALGLLAFWITQVTSLGDLWFGVRMLLSGAIAPIDLLPAGVAVISPYMPFRYMLSFPVEIVMGRLETAEILLGMVVSLGWLIFFWGLVMFLWRRGLRRYGAVGA